jgi:hypothetical protein
MNKSGYFFLLFLLISVSGCESQSNIVVHKLNPKNPVSHIFNLPMEKLKDTILEIFKDQDSDTYLDKVFIGGDYYGHRNPTQQFFEVNSKDDSIPDAYFCEPGRNDDIYLMALTGTWDSKVYFSNGKPMQFQSSYILHLMKLNGGQTLLTVKADSPFVVNGMGGIGVHGPKSLTQKVSPTTIEEYSLILFIASKLGEVNLPPLKLPDS